MIERWRATGPDGAIDFSIADTDQTPLAVAARKAFENKYGRDNVTFTRIDPINAAAQAVIE